MRNEKIAAHSEHAPDNPVHTWTKDTKDVGAHGVLVVADHQSSVAQIYKR